MSTPFEDPAKKDLRRRSEIAIDQSGHTLVEEPALIPLPDDVDLEGAIKGDLQSRDGDGTTHAYYLRTDPERPVPQWLLNFAAASNPVDGLEVHVVLTAHNETTETACRKVGAGLLELTAADVFVEVVRAGAIDDEALAEQLKERAADLTRRLVNKLDLNKKRLQDNFTKVDDLTRDMSLKARDRYIENIEKASLKWTTWSEDVSELIDEAVVSGDSSKLDEVEQRIQDGP